MKEENKKSKKKVLLTYLILAACLLVIAAVTVTLIFTINRNPADNIIDNNQTGNDDDKNNGGNPGGESNSDKDNDKDNDKDKEDDKPANTDTTLCLPVNTASVTAGYDFSYDSTLDRYCVHQGMDFEGTAGDRVCAVLDGTVTKVVADSHIGENYVTITHANGMTSTYKYIEAKDGLKAGDTVKRGDTIGTIAAAAGYEMKQGDHLHFELSVNGKTADPDVYLDIIEK